MVVAKFDKYLHHELMSVLFSVAYLKQDWIGGIFRQIRYHTENRQY